jgi:hypothetical protein
MKSTRDKFSRIVVHGDAMHFPHRTKMPGYFFFINENSKSFALFQKKCQVRKTKILLFVKK